MSLYRVLIEMVKVLLHIAVESGRPSEKHPDADLRIVIVLSVV